VGAYENFVKAYDSASPLIKDHNHVLYKEIREFLIILLNNISQCCINLNKYREAIDYAERAIKLDTRNEKAYFRKGSALRRMGSLQDALVNFEFSDQFKANNDAKNQIIEIKKQLKELKEKEREATAQASKEQKELFQKMWSPDKPKGSEKKETEIQSSKNQGISKTIRNMGIIPFGFLVVPLLLKNGVTKKTSVGTGLLTGLSCYLISLVKTNWIKGLLATLPFIFTLGSLKFKDKLRNLVG